MPTAFDPITGTEVCTSSEAYRHLCECKWLLENKPVRSQKHLWLYGVRDRSNLFRRNPATGEQELRSDLSALWGKDDNGRNIKPIMSWRGLEAADRMLNDAKKIYDHINSKAAA